MNRRDALCLVGTSVTGLTIPGMLAPRAAAAAAPAAPPFDTLLNGFHIDKSDPHAQVETSLQGIRLNEDVLQCVVFHGSGPKLLGVEYIITDRLYRQLPLEEKAYWHPHTHEVLAGHLVAPGLPSDREDELLRDLVTTWGKTWQTWPDPATDLPEGEPLLLWSITRDGQLDRELLNRRDLRLNVSTRANRARRQHFGYAVPQVEPPESVQEIGRQWGGDRRHA
jgi:hypothetical protein